MKIILAQLPEGVEWMVRGQIKYVNVLYLKFLKKPS